MKLLITEQPRTSRPLFMLARKNGSYERPIHGAAIDFRIEDMPGIQQIQTAQKKINHILPLPPVGDQKGKYAIINFGFLDKIIPAGPELQQLLATNKYLVLPYCQKCEHWDMIKRPWWDYAAVMDEYGGPIKAPLIPREDEPTAEEVDERLDDFEENLGKAEVLSPFTLEKQLTGAMSESYLKKLKRIWL